MAFYWALTTITSVGYGEIVPSTRIEVFYTLLVQVRARGAALRDAKLPGLATHAVAERTTSTPPRERAVCVATAPACPSSHPTILPFVGGRRCGLGRGSLANGPAVQHRIRRQGSPFRPKPCLHIAGSNPLGSCRSRGRRLAHRRGIQLPFGTCSDRRSLQTTTQPRPLPPG